MNIVCLYIAIVCYHGRKEIPFCHIVKDEQSWYMLVNSVDSFRYSVAEKLNKLGKGGFDEDAIERQIDMEAGYDDGFDDRYDGQDYDDEDGYLNDDGYDDDLDPSFDENADDPEYDDDGYRGSHD